MSKIKIGVLGAGRGSTMMHYCRQSNDAVLVAICDNNNVFLEKKKKDLKDYDNIVYYSSFDEFIKHDMDAVIVANFADEHAEYAIKCIQNGKHVLSEVLPVQTMSEAIRLIETIEASDKIYAYAENYCYMPVPREMRRKYREGLLGEFEYGEGEYMHNCESIWPRCTQGNPKHWRNNVYSTFYCTHSIGPLLYITGLKPKKVIGLELPYNGRMARMGAKSGSCGIEMITLENGSVIKSLHGLGCSRNSVWYSIYGSKGRMESAREDAELDGVERIYVNCDDLKDNYQPKDEMSEGASGFGHGGSDYYIMYNFIEKIKGNNAETIDIYSALNMFLPGMFAYRSILKGGVTLDIPDLRDKNVRELYRNDNICVNPDVAGEQVIPSYSKQKLVVADEVYNKIRQQWLDSLGEKEKLFGIK